MYVCAFQNLLHLNELDLSIHLLRVWFLSRSASAIRLISKFTGILHVCVCISKFCFIWMNYLNELQVPNWFCMFYMNSAWIRFQSYSASSHNSGWIPNWNCIIALISVHAIHQTGYINMHWKYQVSKFVKIKRSIKTRIY